MVTDELAQAQLHAAVPASTSISAAIRQVDAHGPIREISTPFGYLLPQLADDSRPLTWMRSRPNRPSGR